LQKLGKAKHDLPALTKNRMQILISRPHIAKERLAAPAAQERQIDPSRHGRFEMNGRCFHV